LIEAFENGAAGHTHVNSDHFQTAMAQLPKWLSDVLEIVNTEIPGEGWSRMAEMQLEPGERGS
jgi:quinol monooxygenase YgiN